MSRLVRRFLLILLLLSAVLLIAGTFVPRPLFAPAKGDALARAAPERRILVLSGSIHTDIAIPLDADVRARFSPLAEAGLPMDSADARYLVFGWGSRAFYIGTPNWSDLRPGPLMTALTLDESVMHVGVAGPIDATDGPERSFGVGALEFDRLLGFIEKSFRDWPEAPIPIAGASYGDDDAFFEANGRFTALLGCNTWAAAALRQAGLRTGWWSPIPQTLGLSLDIYN